MPANFPALLLLVALLLLPLHGHAADLSLRFLGQQILPTGYEFAGTTVGGLSGLDYDAARRQFYALSDDRSVLQPARFYTLQLDLDAFNTRADPGHAGVRFTGITPLLDRNGRPFGPKQVDPEAIRLAPSGDRLLWTSEGDAEAGQPPFVAESGLRGEFRRTFPLPDRYAPRAGSGIRHNLAFESLAVVPAENRAYVAIENALVQDGPAASSGQGSACRVLAYDLDSGETVAEHVYLTDPVIQAPALPIQFHTNGLVELLVLDARRLIALERSYTQLAGNSIRLYLAELDGAMDVRGAASLRQGEYRPMSKTLLLDLASLGIAVDNIEGMSWGPPLPNGNRSLILVSDDNFSLMQSTQFLAFEVGYR